MVVAEQCTIPCFGQSTPQDFATPVVGLVHSRSSIAAVVLIVLSELLVQILLDLLVLTSTAVPVKVMVPYSR